MADQNNAPERIWIKPCDPCENPYDYYVCDPRYLDGRETSYVKSIVSCAGCGGGLKRQSGQFVCRDCGKAETVQEVLARADRAAPEGQVGALRSVVGHLLREHEHGCGPITDKQWASLREAHALTPPPAAPTDNTALVEALPKGVTVQMVMDSLCGMTKSGGLTPFQQINARYAYLLIAAALASREAPPAAQEPEPVGCLHGYCNAENCPACSQEEQEAPPACQQEAGTVAEAAQVLLDQPYEVMRRAFAAMERMQGEGADNIMAAALRALKGDQK